jgi:hypothetical protein
VACDDGVDDMGRHVGGVFAGECAASLADGCSDRVNDECVSHYFNLT